MFDLPIIDLSALVAAAQAEAILNHIGWKVRAYMPHPEVPLTLAVINADGETMADGLAPEEMPLFVRAFALGLSAGADQGMDAITAIFAPPTAC